MTRVAVVIFPGSNCDKDCARAIRDVIGATVTEVWHKETSLERCDAVILPGGFSYGDYLRAGAIARFSPIMKEVELFARRGGIVLGICNGFQILVETGILPGALVKNQSLKFICKPVTLKTVRSDTAFSRFTKTDLRIPIAHGQGRYFIDEDGLKRLKDNGQILFRYVENPNGSVDNIAGIISENGNVLGMMPHPERACESAIGNSEDGRLILKSMLESAA